MTMGKRRRRGRQAWMGVASTDLPRSTGHPFYARLNRVLDEAGFDGFVEAQCASFYADGVGRPRLAPGRYFRLLLSGYFEELDSERAIAWRASGIPTPRRAELPRLERKRPKKGSNDDWTHPDPDAKIRKTQDGRTDLAHKAEQAVDLETGVVVGVTVQNPAAGDTETMVELNRLGPPGGLGAVREPCLRQMVDQPALNVRGEQGG